LYKHRETVGDALEAREAVAATLLNRHFVHFAGSWFESQVWSAAVHGAFLGDQKLEALVEEVFAAELSGHPVGRIVPGDPR
jgi:hypothetical protein